MGMNQVCLNANIHLHGVHTSEWTYKISNLAALQNIYRLTEKDDYEIWMFVLVLLDYRDFRNMTSDKQL